MPPPTASTASSTTGSATATSGTLTVPSPTGTAESKARTVVRFLTDYVGSVSGPSKFIGVLVLGGLVIVFVAAKSWPSAVLISAAITAASGVIGFLFGIPRSAGGDGVSDSSVTAGGTATARASSGSRNTSLEQVADWLTKLLLGAGLTQLTEIRLGLISLSHAIAACSGATTNGRPSTEAVVLGLGVIGYFSALGFVGGYLSTRLLLVRLLIWVDLNAEQLQKNAEETGRLQGLQEGAQEGLTQGLASGRDQIERDLNQHKIETQESAIAAAAAADPQLQAALKSAEAWEPPVTEADDDDPQKGRFGGSATANQRILSADVHPLNKEDGELFQIILKVSSLAGAPAPLTGPVKFFLHYTFPQKTVVVPPKGGTATLELVAWGAFTVGAITDDGNTLLELDLATLAAAPQKFRDR